MRFGVALFSLFIVCLIPSTAQTTGGVQNFASADSVASLYPNHSLQALDQLSSKLTCSLSSEEEKFRSIYRWVCDNIAFDYFLSLELKKVRRDNKPENVRERNRKFSQRAEKILLEEHKTVCTGYAWLVQKLSSLAGIQCVMVDGYGRTSQSRINGAGSPNHSWNAVRLNGKWYLCDPTWSSGTYDSNLGIFIPVYNDAYFLTDPAVFVRNHYPQDPKWMLLDSKSTLDQFLNGPLFYSHGIASNIDRLYPETFNINAKRGEPITVQVGRKNSEPVGKIQFYVNKSSRKEFVTPAIQCDSTGLYSLHHAFPSKGIYSVHLMLDDLYALSYRVNVE